jgi:hypothetical protein
MNYASALSTSQVKPMAEADHIEFLHRAITTDPFFNILILLKTNKLWRQ